MGVLRSQVGPVAASEQDLRDRSQRDREGLERLQAVLKAEQAGRRAEAAEFAAPEQSEQETAHFGEQLGHIEAILPALTRVEADPASGQAQRAEARRLESALREAERSDTRPMEAQAQDS